VAQRFELDLPLSWLPNSHKIGSSPSKEGNSGFEFHVSFALDEDGFRSTFLSVGLSKFDPSIFRCGVGF
jgi:hypothetical protein